MLVCVLNHLTLMDQYLTNLRQTMDVVGAVDVVEAVDVIEAMDEVEAMDAEEVMDMVEAEVVDVVLALDIGKVMHHMDGSSTSH